MVALLIVIGCIALFFVAYNLQYSFDVPKSFSCGSDEICYCEKSEDCIRKVADEEEKK